MNTPTTSGQETSQVQKTILTQSKIANVQLAALNLTNLDIAASNRRIEAIHRNTLNETKRQTAVLELQLEETKLAKLEKTRQQQLKQAAFSLNKEMDILKSYKTFPRMILVKKLNADVAEVGLEAAELYEIHDKEYTDAVLNKLEEFSSSTERELLDNDRKKVLDFETGLNDLNALTRQVSISQNESVRAKEIVSEKKQSLANNSKRKKYTYPAVTFFLMMVLVVIVSIMLAASPDESSVMGIAVFLFMLIGLGVILCPVWVLINLVHNSTIKIKLDSRQIQQLNGEIKSLEEKIKNLADQEADSRNRLKMRQQMLSNTIAEYPELKDLALQFDSVSETPLPITKL